jgi:hypothetical protein
MALGAVQETSSRLALTGLQPNKTSGGTES